MSAADLQISQVRFTRGNVADEEAGLLGYVSCVANGVVAFDGISVRKTREGRIALSFPARRDRKGHDHAYIRPLDSVARVRIEEQVFAQLPAAIEEARR